MCLGIRKPEAMAISAFSLTWHNNDFSVLQIVAGHRSWPTIWVSWSLKIDADFLIINKIIKSVQFITIISHANMLWT